MPFYIFHQTIIVILGFWTIGWVDMPLAKYALIAVLSLIISIVLSHVALRVSALRVMLGIKSSTGQRIIAAPMALR